MRNISSLIEIGVEDPGKICLLVNEIFYISASLPCCSVLADVVMYTEITETNDLRLGKIGNY